MAQNLPSNRRDFETVRDFSAHIGYENCSKLYTVLTDAQLQTVISAGSLNYSQNFKFWLSPTLFQGRIPDRSPYGSKMLLFDADYILSLLDPPPILGFIEARHFPTKGTQYIRLSMDFYEVMEADLKELDISKNPFFCKDPDTDGQFRVVKNYEKDVATMIVHIRIYQPIPLVEGKYWIKDVEFMPVSPGGYEGKLGTLGEIDLYLQELQRSLEDLP